MRFGLYALTPQRAPPTVGNYLRRADPGNEHIPRYVYAIDIRHV